jgi:hypothetical protein
MQALRFATSDTNLPGTHDHELASLEVNSVLLQRLIQMFDLRLQLGPGKPEKQDACMAKPLVKNQLADPHGLGGYSSFIQPSL